MNNCLFFCILLVTAIANGFAQPGLGEAIDLVNTGRYDEAMRLVEARLRDNGADDRAHFVRAVILVRNKNYTAALASLEAAIAHNPSHAEYYRLAGQLYEELNNAKSALGAWEKCRALTEDTRLFVEAKNHIAYLGKK